MVIFWLWNFKRPHKQFCFAGLLSWWRHFCYLSRYTTALSMRHPTVTVRQIILSKSFLNLRSNYTRHYYPGAVDPHLRVHRVRHPADLRHHPRQRPDDHPGQSSDERIMIYVTPNLGQGLILNDEGELEEEDNRNDLKKPKSAWSDSNHFNNFSKVF